MPNQDIDLTVVYRAHSLTNNYELKEIAEYWSRYGYGAEIKTIVYNAKAIDVLNRLNTMDVKYLNSFLLNTKGAQIHFCPSKEEYDMFKSYYIDPVFGLYKKTPAI